MINLNYDKKYDVLYIALADKEKRKNSFGDEEYNGLVVMRDEFTDDITSLMIMGFADKYRSHKIPILPQELKINFEKDIVPFIDI